MALPPVPQNTLDLSYGDAPALHPDVIVTRVKEVYDQTLIGRKLLKSEQIPTDSVSYIVEGDIVGSVDFITEEGGFPKIDFQYSKRAKVVRPYGSYFDVTMQERKWARIPTVSRKISRAVRQVRKFEDDIIFHDIINAPEKNTFDGSDWTDTTSGDPVADLEKAKRLIRDATDGMEPDIVLMSSQMFENITKFDTVRNALYHSARYVEKGQLQQLCGLNIVINNQIDPNSDQHHALVLKTGELGYMAESISLQTPSVEGLLLSNPMIDRRYFIYAQSEPVIDTPESCCLVTGLNA